MMGTQQSVLLAYLILEYNTAHDSSETGASHIGLMEEWLFVPEGNQYVHILYDTFMQ